MASKKRKKGSQTTEKKTEFRLNPVVFYSIAGIIALCGLFMVMSAQSLYGPGLTSDSVSYISTAQNLAEGKGFTRFDGTPFISWPPLYPLVLSISALIGIDVTIFAGLLGCILFGCIIFFSILLAEKVLSSRVYGLITGVVVLFSAALVNTAIMAWSEALFTTFILVAALFARKLRADYRLSDLLLFALFTSLACLSRYVGIAVFGSGLVFIMMLRERSIGHRIKYTGIYSVISVLPLFVWLIRNKVVHGTMTGSRSEASSGIVQNIVQTLKVMGFTLFNAKVGGAMIFAVVLPLAIWTGWSVMRSKKSFPFTLYISVFYILFLITIASFISFDVINDRLLAPVLPFVIILIVRMLLIGREKLKSNIRAVLLIPLFIWILMMGITTVKFVSKAGKQGAGHYNSDLFRNSPLFNAARSSGIKEPVYSNFPDLLYINANLDARWTPMSDGTMTELSDRVEAGETVTIMWFFYERGSSKRLAEFLELDRIKIINRFQDGWIGTYSKRTGSDNN